MKALFVLFLAVSRKSFLLELMHIFILRYLISARDVWSASGKGPISAYTGVR